MEKEIVVSIIIPAYNAGKTLGRCLDSILEQNYQSYEIIVVNDGSSDETETILQQYQVRDKRVRYLTKVNGGVSSARNMGIDKAEGEFIVFIDSDDYVLPSFSDALKYIGEADWIVFPFNTSNYSLQKKLIGVSQLDDLRNAMLYPTLGSIDISGISFASPWGKIYRSDIIKENNLRFKDNLHMGEDLVFNLYYLEFVSLVSCRKENYYIYCDDNQISATRKYQENYFVWDIEFQREIKKYIVKYERTPLCAAKCLSAMNGVYRCITYYAHPQNKMPLTYMLQQMQNTLPTDEYYEYYSEFKPLIKSTFGWKKNLCFLLCKNKFCLIFVSIVLKGVSIIRRLKG